MTVSATNETARGAPARPARVAAPPELPGALVRVSFRFSPAGTAAACLAGPGDGSLRLESWSFGGGAAEPGGAPAPRVLDLDRPVTIVTQPLPLDDGRVLLCRTGDGCHQVSLVEPHERPEDPPRERVLAMMACRGLRLLPAPGAAGGSGGPGLSAAAALAVALDERGHSTVWLVSERRPWLERLVEVPGLLAGGAWLDRDGRLLGADRLADPESGPAKAIALDLRDGAWSALLDVAETSNDRLLLASPRSGLLLVSTDAPGEERLGWAVLGRREPVRFPQALRRPGLRALATDPEGRRVLLRLDKGARSRLASYEPATDRLEPLPIPDGHVRATAAWTAEAIRFPFSSPAHPPGVATLRPGGRSPVTTGPAGGTGAHVEPLEGAAGPVETIVYGGRDWRAAERVVLALHGGPLDAWRFEFDPLFQVLAAAGIAVVAPNQRGSSGYGPAHALAVRGAWGGPDLADVRRIAHDVAVERHRLRAGEPGDLALLGLSYGAFLALLAASAEPGLWSRCVALAPFLSGPRLFEDGAADVRDLLQRLGGCERLHDALGPRDVLRLVPAMRARLLLVHGAGDEVIPVAHSRALRRRLVELGRDEGGDFEYLEVPGGHELVSTAGTPALRDRILRFLIDEGR